MLVSRSLKRHNFREDIGLPEDRKCFLRRPLANELFQVLAQNDNAIKICTAVPKDHCTHIIASANLTVPPSTTTICREDNRKLLIAEKLADPRYGSEITFLSNEDDMLSGGMYKVPSVLGIEVLLDDAPDVHEQACDIVGRPDDKKKIIPVDPFLLRDLKHLGNHHKDQGLLKAAKVLAEFFK